jgi:hypothetical protein
MTNDAARQMASLAPTDAKSLAEFRRVVSGAFDVLIGRELPGVADVDLLKMRTEDRPECMMTTGVIQNRPNREQLPVVLLKPKSWNKRVVIWADGAGKSALFDGSELRPAVKKLLDAGAEVVGVDLLYQGEFLADGHPVTKTRRVDKSRDYAGFTDAYNHPLFSQRVHDLLTLIAAIRNLPEQPERVYLVGTGGAGPLAAAARAQAGDAIDRLAIDTRHFRFADITSIDDPDFLPGAAKYGDLEALLALSAPHELWIAGESPNRLELPRSTYCAAGAEKRQTIDAGSRDSLETRAVGWLLH